jgi:hypothetical protein
MNLREFHRVSETEVSFSVMGDADLVSDSDSSVWPRSVTIIYRWWVSDEGPKEYRCKTWKVKVHGKCPPGSTKKTSTVVFHGDDPGVLIPGEIKSLIEEKAPSEWTSFKES